VAPARPKYDAIEVTQGDRTFFLTRLPAGLVTKISYAAVRGKDDEPGAVQRVLNSRRIASVRDFTLQGGDFPSALVLNWVSEKQLIFDGRVLTLSHTACAPLRLLMDSTELRELKPPSLSVPTLVSFSCRSRYTPT
jgi:hypothetical protein